MKRRKPNTTTAEAARLLAGFAVDTALNRYAVRIRLRGRVLTITLTARK